MRACSKGFTLLELIVSMSIFLVISGFVVVNYRLGARQDEVRFSANIVSGIFKDVEARAGAGAVVTTCVTGATKRALMPDEVCVGGVNTTEVPGAWGLSFGTQNPSDKIVVFVDLNGNRTFDPDTELVHAEPLSSSGFVTITAATPVALRTDIVFVPPSLSVLVNGAPPAAGDVTLTLTHGAGAGSRTLHFNPISHAVRISNP